MYLILSCTPTFLRSNLCLKSTFNHQIILRTKTYCIKILHSKHLTASFLDPMALRSRRCLMASFLSLPERSPAEPRLVVSWLKGFLADREPPYHHHHTRLYTSRKKQKKSSIWPHQNHVSYLFRSRVGPLSLALKASTTWNISVLFFWHVTFEEKMFALAKIRRISKRQTHPFPGFHCNFWCLTIL